MTKQLLEQKEELDRSTFEETKKMVDLIGDTIDSLMSVDLKLAFDRSQNFEQSMLLGLSKQSEA